MDRDVLLEALGVICNATVTSIQKQKSEGQRMGGVVVGGPSGVLGAALGVLGAALGGFGAGFGALLSLPTLFTRTLISTVVDGDQTCQVSRSNLHRMQGAITNKMLLTNLMQLTVCAATQSGRHCTIDEDEFFDHRYDYDFTNITDTVTYYRGGEEYERPCGWHRSAIRVLDKYDDNTWLGTTTRSTESVKGEWPVSYHGTSYDGAAGIIKGQYKPGSGDRYGRGGYSTPDLSVAAGYAKSFQSKKTGKWYKVILQNRINPKYREKYNDDQYWLVSIPSDEDEQKIVEDAIRPYGLLLKEE